MFYHTNLVLQQKYKSNENKILRYTVINLSISKLLVGNYLLPTINYVLCITIVEDDILLPIAILSNKRAPSVRPPPEN